MNKIITISGGISNTAGRPESPDEPLNKERKENKKKIALKIIFRQKC